MPHPMPPTTPMMFMTEITIMSEAPARRTITYVEHRPHDGVDDDRGDEREVAVQVRPGEEVKLPGCRQEGDKKQRASEEVADRKAERR